MEVGTSKKKGLFSNFKGLENGTFQGTVSTQRKWSDFETQPLIANPVPVGNGTSATTQARLVSPVTHRAEDVARITKLLAKPGGILWESHQLGLETIQNRLTRKKLGEDNKLLSAIGQSLVSNVGLTAETLAQVAVVGTGEHLTPFLSRSYLKKGGGKTGTLSKILSAIGIGRGDNLNGGADALGGTKIEGTPKHTFIQTSGESKSRDGEYALIGSKLNNPVDPYGKPVTTDWNVVPGKENGEYVVQNKFVADRGRDSVEKPTQVDSIERFNRLLGKQTTVTSKSELSIGGKPTDPLKAGVSEDDVPKDDLQASVYSKWLREQPIGANSLRVETRLRGGLQEQLEERTFSGTSEESTTIRPTVWLRKAPLDTQVLEKSTPTSVESLYGNEKYNLDQYGLIPFEISSITPETRYYMAFRAHLDSLDDGYTSGWSATQYVGRADNFYLYNQFDRQINFSFKVLAGRPDELAEIYQKLNRLASSTAPSYKKGDVNFMRGTLSSVTIGEYLLNVKGFFKNVKFSWKTDYMWEIGEKFLNVPQVLDISVQFTPIHDFIPSSDLNLKDKHYFGDDRQKNPVQVNEWYLFDDMMHI